ncbi:transmembrane protein, putative (macronuclear) [Tetrahymena thermophila SB210]|uniref:Transmembrane protein, putative n=1 Tax=Tetrahymena thermophila (strain SB210) TaxID=312017 RepID=Q24C91_TETTS|nr:transmembrane protein, putative [Tetrahymena thermophila SB210]EAS05347.1 transmembrane protein, putative [Tetrahymena thermophila SB210]|eukprot:XP_001025592.1 transmembrane protein, putative [Tetrahymena thermophila SB210]
MRILKFSVFLVGLSVTYLQIALAQNEEIAQKAQLNNQNKLQTADSQQNEMNQQLNNEDQFDHNQYENQVEEGENEVQDIDGEQDVEHHQKYTSDDPEFYTFIIIATVLVAFAGICSGLTVGYLGITNLQLDIILRNGTSQEKEAAKKIKPLIKDHHLLLSTLLLSNSIAMEALPIFLDAVCPAWLAVLISTVAVVIVGEIIPQAYCTGKYQLRIGQFFAPLTTVLMKVLYCFTKPVAIVLDKLLGVHDNSRLENKEDIVGLVELQQIDNNNKHNSNLDSQKGLTDDEIKLVTSTMQLREKNVTKHMQPYAKIFKLPENQLVNQKLLNQIARRGYSNIVVHEVDNESKVIGILKAKQLIDYVDTDINSPINEIVKLQEPILISEQTNLLELMMIFQNKKSTVALVFETKNVKKSENILDNLEDPQLEERLGNRKNFKGFILGLISLKDIFEVMINQSLLDEDKHESDPLNQVIRTLGQTGAAARRRRITSNQFASIRKKY